MGRYYSGDIEGKFAFAIQDSNAANRFGVIGCEPNYIHYYFDKDDLPTVQAELKVIENTLGENKQRIDDYFGKHACYTNDDIARTLGVSIKDLRHLLSEYYDYALGKKIEQCIISQGCCSFDAEY